MNDTNFIIGNYTRYYDMNCGSLTERISKEIYVHMIPYIMIEDIDGKL